MAERRILIQIGQSNGSAIGDLKSWNDIHPFLAISSPNTNHGAVPTYSQGSKSDQFTLSSRWAGGPTIDQLGATVSGTHQTVNLRGRAINGIRFWTPFNPSSTHATYNTRATCYPGRAEISLLPDVYRPQAWRFQTNHQSQGAQHIEEVASIATTTLTTVANPNSLADDDLVAFSLKVGGSTMPPEVDEKQVYQVTGRTATTFQLKPWPQVVHDASVPLLSIATTANVNVQKSELGTITRRRTGTTHTAAHGTPGSLNPSLFMSIDPPMTAPLPEVGEQFDFPITLGDDTAVSGWTSSKAGPMVFRNRFGGLSSIGDGPVENCRLRAPFYSANVVQDRSMRVTCAGLPAKLGMPVSFGSVTGTTRNTVSVYDVTENAASTFTSGVDDFSVGGLFENGDRVQLTGTIPTGFNLLQDYWVVNASGATCQLSETEGGSAVTPTSSGTCGIEQHTYDVYVNAVSLAFIESIRMDEKLIFTGVGVPAALVGVSVYVIEMDRTTGRIQVSTTPGGSPANFPFFATALMQVDVQLPTDGVTTVLPGSIYYVARMAQREIDVNEKLTCAASTANNNFTSLNHTLLLHERVRVTGDDIPDELMSGRTYYVRTLDGPTTGSPTTPHSFQLSSTHDGAAITFATGTAITIERIEEAHSFYVSETPGGPEVVINSNTQNTLNGTFRTRERFEGSLSGMQCRCISGTAANIGAVVHMSNIELLNDSSQDIATCAHEDEWPAIPQSGDVFVLEPPPLEDGTPVPWEKFGEALPWSPLEGRATGGSTVTSTPMNPGPNADNGVGQIGQAINIAAKHGEKIRFYTEDPDAILPHRIEAGRSYFMVEQTGTTGYFSETYDGPIFDSPRIEATAVGSDQITVSNHDLEDDYPVVFRGDNIPAEITAGTSYYAIVVDNSKIQISATRGGSAMTLTAPADLDMQMFFPGTSREAYAVHVRGEGRSNPYPPGINYANQQILPQAYQAYLGGSLQGNGGCTSAITTSLRMHDYFGEPIIVLNLAFGGTSLAHKEVIPGGIEDGSATGIADVLGLGWLDLKQQISWSESDPSGCYAVALDMVDGINLALQREGHTGKVELVVWNQGEEDSVHVEMANRYQSNLNRFKASFRAALKARGLWAGDANKIPWVQPLPLEDYATYSEDVIAAIKAEHESDPYARWCEAGAAIEQKSELYQFDEDDIHYTGRGMNVVGNRVFDSWLQILRTGRDEVDICNLALAHLGDSAKIQTLGDSSRQAQLCAQYYDLARDGMLELHRWEFATTRRTLVSVTKDAAVTQWDYAYALPSDWVDTISILPDNAPDDYFDSGVRQPVPYAIEQDAQGDRVLLTNEVNADMRYTFRNVDTTKFSGTFVKALSWYLASMIAGPLIKGEEGAKQAQIAENRAFRAFAVASKHDARGKRKQERPTTTYAWRR